MYSRMKMQDWMALGEKVGGAAAAYQNVTGEREIQDRTQETVQTPNEGGLDAYRKNYEATGDVGVMTDQGVQYGPQTAYDSDTGLDVPSINAKTVQPTQQQYKLGDKTQDREFTPAEVRAKNDEDIREFWKRAGTYGESRLKNADEAEARGLQKDAAKLTIKKAKREDDTLTETDAIKSHYDQMIKGLGTPEGDKLVAAFVHVHPNEFGVSIDPESGKFRVAAKDGKPAGEIDINDPEGRKYAVWALSALRDGDLAAIDPAFRKQLTDERAQTKKQAMDEEHHTAEHARWERSDANDAARARALSGVGGLSGKGQMWETSTGLPASRNAKGQVQVQVGDKFVIYDEATHGGLQPVAAEKTNTGPMTEKDFYGSPVAEKFKDYQTYLKSRGPQPWPEPSPASVKALQADPSKAAVFDEAFGQGAAAKHLGGDKQGGQGGGLAPSGQKSSAPPFTDAEVKASKYGPLTPKYIQERGVALGIPAAVAYAKKARADTSGYGQEY